MNHKLITINFMIILDYYFMSILIIDFNFIITQHPTVKFINHLNLMK